MQVCVKEWYVAHRKQKIYFGREGDFLATIPEHALKGRCDS
jgi:hypothetical protein